MQRSHWLRSQFNQNRGKFHLLKDDTHDHTKPWDCSWLLFYYNCSSVYSTPLSWRHNISSHSMHVKVYAWLFPHLLVFQLLFLQQSLQILHVVVLEVLDEAPGSLQALLDCKTCCLIPVETRSQRANNKFYTCVIREWCIWRIKRMSSTNYRNTEEKHSCNSKHSGWEERIGKYTSTYTNTMSPLLE